MPKLGTTDEGEAALHTISDDDETGWSDEKEIVFTFPWTV